MSTTTKNTTTTTTEIPTPLMTLQKAQNLTEQRRQELGDAKSTWLSLDARESHGDDTVTTTERTLARDNIDKYARLLEHAEAAKKKAKSAWERATAAESPDIAEAVLDIIKPNLFHLGLSPATPILIQPQPLDSAPKDITIVLCQTKPTTHDLGWGTCSGRVWICVFAPSIEDLPAIDAALMKLMAQSNLDASGGNTAPIESVEGGVYKPYSVDVKRAVIETPHLPVAVSAGHLKALGGELERGVMSTGLVHDNNGRVCSSRVKTSTSWINLISSAQSDGIGTRVVRVGVAADGVMPEHIEELCASPRFNGAYFTGVGRCRSINLVTFRPTGNGYRRIEVEMTFQYRVAK